MKEILRISKIYQEYVRNTKNMQEIRRICHARKHSLTNFQRQQFISFNEETSEQVNIWTGTIEIALENTAVLLET